jgi:hypothetical protein
VQRPPTKPKRKKISDFESKISAKFRREITTLAPHNKMGKGQHAPKGRSLCLKHLQFVSLPYTPPSTGKSKKDKSQQKYQKLDRDEFIECH